MRNTGIFQQYIWLLNTIHRAGRITLSEINKKWIQCNLSNGVEMPRSTFNRHKNDIEELFNVVIECDKNDGYKYYIENPEAISNNSIQNWLLSSLTVHSAVRESVSLQKRILLEDIPSGHQYLQQILMAMKSNKRIAFHYKKYNDTETKFHAAAEPYCLKLYKQRWYLLTKEDGKLITYSLDRFQSLEILSSTFQMDTNFDAETHFRHCFGVYQDNHEQPQEVVLRVRKNERPYLRDLPLHHSQKEINTTVDYSDFSYYLYPTSDFIGQILRKGNRIQVISPKTLREKTHDIIQEMLKNYE